MEAHLGEADVALEAQVRAAEAGAVLPLRAAAFSTYQPSPRGTSPCSVVTISASSMAVVSPTVPRFLANPAVRPDAVQDPSADAAAFHVRMPCWRETPVRRLDAVAAELGLTTVALKDESDRLGLPAFKGHGASWAIERALREAPDTRTLVAASAGNHGRAVAHVAARRGLGLPRLRPRPLGGGPPVRDRGRGRRLVVVDGDYEVAVARAREAAAGRERSRSPTSGTRGPRTG